MTATKIIAAYNALNGKKASRAQLSKLHTAAFDLLPEESKEVKTIWTKLGAALDQLEGHNSAIINISSPVKAPMATKTRTKKAATLSGIDDGLLSGLEYIEDDSDINGQTLGGTDSVYDIITKSIIKIIKRNKGKVSQKWKQSPLFRMDGLNFNTKKYYSGINWIMLNAMFGSRLQDSPYFLTMKQANRMGGKVKKGSDGYPVFYYTMVHKNKEGKVIPKQEWENLPDGEEGDKFPSPRYYQVFNSDNIEGIDFGLPEEPEGFDFKEIDTAEKIVDLMPKRPPISNKGSKAYYMPSKDAITMPPQSRFEEAGNYYSTLFHELVHSTAHKTRVGRVIGTNDKRAYAFEELIAELGASFLNSHAGLKYYKLEGNAGYIQSYNDELIGFMKKDNKYILKAAAAAQKAADFILAGKDYRLTEFKGTKKPNTINKTVKRIEDGLKNSENHFKKVIANSDKILLTASDTFGASTFKEGKVKDSVRRLASNAYKHIILGNERIVNINRYAALGVAIMKLDKAKTLDIVHVAMASQYASRLIEESKNKSVPRSEKKQPKKAVKTAAPTKESKQLSLELAGLSGFTRLDQTPTDPTNIFTLPGAIGKWLGEQQRFRLVISLDGETHAGKSELAKQIVNAMAAHGFKVAWFDLEQGGMSSKDTAASFARNVDPANSKNIFVIGEAAQGVDTIKQYAASDQIDVIAIDSATKINPNNNAWFEDLRVKYPTKIFIPIWQQNEKGGTRGGSSITFDAPVHIKVYRPDHDNYKANFAEFLKNRGNATNDMYMIADKYITNTTEDDNHDI